MSEQRDMIVDTAHKLLGGVIDKAMLDAAEAGEWQGGVLAELVQAGFHVLGSPDSGTDADELFAFVEVAGYHAAPLPIADTLLANRWLGPIEGATSFGVLEGDVIRGASWAAHAERVVGLQADAAELVVVAPELIETRLNLAGEPCADVRVGTDAQRVAVGCNPWLWAALSRAALAAGGLRSVLEQTITYATDREQFGRPISKFQAVQHMLAVMAAEVAAALRAVGAGVDALDSDRALAEVASAKSRVGEAITVVAEASHQVHGAIGFTHEHRLHHSTRRLWAWRDEFGNEVFWQRRLGEVLVALGADATWDFVAA